MTERRSRLREMIEQTDWGIASVSLVLTGLIAAILGHWWLIVLVALALGAIGWARAATRRRGGGRASETRVSRRIAHRLESLGERALARIEEVPPTERPLLAKGLLAGAVVCWFAVALAQWGLLLELPVIAYVTRWTLLRRRRLAPAEEDEDWQLP